MPHARRTPRIMKMVFELGSYAMRYVLCALLFLSCFILSAHAGSISPDLETLLQSVGPNVEIAVIVTFHGKADLSFYRDDDKDLRRSKIVKALKTQFDLNGKGATTYLQNQGISRIIPLWIMNGMAATLPVWLVTQVASLPQVENVSSDAVVEAPPVLQATAAPPEWNISAVKAPDLWNIGFTGAGVVVANMDTGVDIFHPDLSSKWRGGTSSWYNPYSDPVNASNCATPNQCSACEIDSTTPCDIDGHGTGTMGIMVGGSAGGTAIGVAPDSKWIAVKIFNDASVPQASLSIVHQGFQWIINLPAGQAPDIVNNSWGLSNPNGCDLTFQASIQALKAAGISVVFAAGNSGGLGPSSSISPANNVDAFAVGATDINNAIAFFSSRGPSPSVAGCGNGAIFPHVVAPGVSVKTSDVTNGGLFPNSYAIVSGTSFSAPHAAGAMALLTGVFPTLTPVQLESILEQTAFDLGATGPDNTYGYGLVDIANAYTNAFNTVNGSIPEIASLPSSNNFGNMETKKTSLPQVFTIVNRGTANLVINPSPNGVFLSGTDPSDFIITSDTCSGQTISSLLSCTVRVSFSPSSTGTKDASLSIRSNDPATPALGISLVGNGVRLTEIGVFRNGLWALDLNGNHSWDGTSIDGLFTFGQAGDIAVTGDWTGTGTTRIGIFRNGLWALDLNGNGLWDGPSIDAVFTFGQAGDIPVTGDWTGTGTTKIGIFRNGLWALDLNGNGVAEFPGDSFFTFGQAGDIPVVGTW